MIGLYVKKNTTLISLHLSIDSTVDQQWNHKDGVNTKERRVSIVNSVYILAVTLTVGISRHLLMLMHLTPKFSGLGNTLIAVVL